jgi:hypothetical protein
MSARLEHILSRGETLAQYVDPIAPSNDMLKAARIWSDELYEILATERVDLVRRLLRETDEIVEITVMASPAKLVREQN